jgi:hypothetical protein
VTAPAIPSLRETVAEGLAEVIARNAAEVPRTAQREKVANYRAALELVEATSNGDLPALLRAEGESS